MKKSLLFLAAIAALGVSCSKTVSSVQQPGQEAEDEAVRFGAYVNRGVTSKAGMSGTMDLAALKVSGFGVFGYYTNDEPYSPAARPDFMYNQQVINAAGSWDYAPVKYWPNNYGAGAESDAIDRLSFFAYAPYVDVTYSTGLVNDNSTTGITALTRNTAAGDPLVKYTASMDPATNVDLLWGVAAGNFTSSVDGNSNTVDAGNPFLNLIKPKTGDRLNFDFKHALAALNVQIDTDVDVQGHQDGDLAPDTRIYVRSITFEGFTTKGALNLNSKAGSPIWTDLSGASRPDNTPVTVFDGRRDGREGVTSAVAANETPVGLNPAVVQSVPYDDASLTPGVTHDAVNLFNGAGLTTPVLVIPNGQSMKVTIVYDVETKDPKLATTLADRETLGSSIENAITKAILLTSGDDLTLEAGKKYTLTLHLGMTSVKVGATVSDWDVADSADTDLPGNVTTSASLGIGGVTVTPGSSEGI